MSSNRILTGKQQRAEMEKFQKRPSRNPNPYNIVFDNPEQERRYQIHRKRKLTSTRYMCENTLTALGLKIEVDWMFHVLGMLEFMSLEAPTYERITLEFLSTLEFQLEKRWVNTTRYYFGTLVSDCLTIIMSYLLRS